MAQDATTGTDVKKRRRADRAGNHMPTSLHKNVPVAVRLQVEKALRSQEPGLATYEAVYQRFNLAEHGISITALERHGKRIRDEAKASGQRWQEAVLAEFREMGRVLVSRLD